MSQARTASPVCQPPEHWAHGRCPRRRAVRVEPTGARGRPCDLLPCSPLQRESQPTCGQGLLVFRTPDWQSPQATRTDRHKPGARPCMWLCIRACACVCLRVHMCECTRVRACASCVGACLCMCVCPCWSLSSPNAPRGFTLMTSPDPCRLPQSLTREGGQFRHGKPRGSPGCLQTTAG